MRIALRKRLRAARAATIHQDASHGRLAIRVQYCGADLQPRCDFLGSAHLAKDWPSNGLGVAAATEDAVTRFFMSNSNAPQVAKVDRPTPTDEDVAACAEFCGHAEGFNTDAAADERKAAETLRGPTPLQPDEGRTSCHVLFPNLKML